LIILRFGNSIPEEKQDHALKDKLRGEADGIFAWALVGLRRVMERGWRFEETERAKAEMRQYMTESSNALAFVEEMCVVEDGRGVLPQ
jgi:putative DNA primase/helicase